MKFPQLNFYTQKNDFMEVAPVCRQAGLTNKKQII